jgi:hypothetical protein
MQNKPNFGERAGGPNTQYSTILSFHHSRPVPIVQNEPNFVPPQAAGRRRLCRTKPNLGRLGYVGKAVGVWGVVRPGVKRAKRTQFGDRDVQNEPNLDRPGAGAGGKMRKTKPNLEGLGHLGKGRRMGRGAAGE